MKSFAKITLAAATILSVGATAMAQQNFKEDPRYGNTPEEREQNVIKLNLLRVANSAREWNEAAVYVRDLMNDAPKASQSIYQYGTAVYKNLIARATSVDQKKIYVDSVMLIYDRRVEHFGNTATPQGITVLHMKAQDYLNLNPMDRAGVRKFYKDAVDAGGTDVKPDLVLEYFQQLVTDYKSVEISPEELMVAYEQLTPLMENASQENKDTFTGLFATSGAANCNTLEELYSKELASKPGDVELLKKAYGLMSMANCDSDFYISVAEQYYAAEPTSSVAIRLAILFEKRDQFDKALTYLNPQIETETDPAAKSDLLVRVAYSELGLKRYSAAAQTARQAIALNSNNGLAYTLLGETYIGGATGCSGFDAQTVYWLAYDQFARAREAFEGNPSEQQMASNRMALCRANFPTNDDIFLRSHTISASYQVRCGWISGTTTVRAR